MWSLNRGCSVTQGAAEISCHSVPADSDQYPVPLTCRAGHTQTHIQLHPHKKSQTQLDPKIVIARGILFPTNVNNNNNNNRGREGEIERKREGESKTCLLYVRIERDSVHWLGQK